MTEAYPPKFIEPQLPRQPTLRGRRRPQVVPPHHKIDPKIKVIDHRRQLICRIPILFPHHEVGHLDRYPPIPDHLLISHHLSIPDHPLLSAPISPASVLTRQLHPSLSIDIPFPRQVPGYTPSGLSRNIFARLQSQANTLPRLPQPRQTLPIHPHPMHLRPDPLVFLRAPRSFIPGDPQKIQCFKYILHIFPAYPLPVQVVNPEQDRGPRPPR